MQVLINGIPYIVAAGERFEWGYAQQLSNPIRTTGIPSRQDNALIARIPLRWNKGLGFQHQDRETGEGVGGLQDADADTFHHHLTLPHLNQAVTLPDVVNRVGATVIPAVWVNFKGELFLVHHDRASTGSSGNPGVGNSTYESDDTYNTHVDIQVSGAVARTVEGADIVEHKGSLFVLYAIDQGNDSVFVIETSGAGTSWSTVSGTGFPTGDIYLSANVVPANGGLPFGLLLDAVQASRHDLIAALQEDSAANGGTTDQTRIYHTADSGTNFTNTANVPGQPRGKAMWYDPYSSNLTRVPFISTTTNVFLIDPANSDAVPILPAGIVSGQTASTATSGGFMVEGHDGGLYVSDALGDVHRISIPNIPGPPPIHNLGPVTHVPGGGDGLIAARRGPVTAMVAGTTCLFVAFQGATYSHIMKLRYSDLTWHSFFVHDSTELIYQMALSAADDGTPRLHAMVDVGNTIELYQWERPEESLASITAPTKASGHVNFAEDDMFDPNNSSTVLQTIIAADDLSASESGEYVEYYGDDQDGDWGNTDRGSFLSGDNDLLFAAGVGLSARSMKNRLVLHRDGGTNTDTPKIESLEIQAVTSQSVLRSPLIPIDLTKTQEQYDRPVETQIETLEALFKLSTQFTVELGNTGSFLAIVRDPPSFQLRVEQGDEQMDRGRLTGIAYIRFTQLLEGV